MSSETMESSNGDSDDQAVDFGGDGNQVGFLVFWLLCTAAIIYIPFCGTQKRRKLWCQRIRERRWVPEQLIDEDDWYVQATRRRQAERQQRLREEYDRFQASRTQEDEIREQYLIVLLENYSKILSQSDLIGKEKTRSEKKTPGSSKLDSHHASNKRFVNGNVVEDDSMRKSGYSGSKRGSKVANVEDEDEKALEEIYFDGQCEAIRVPIAGEMFVSQQDDIEAAMGGDDEESSGVPLSQNFREVPNGCAICLSSFMADEKVTWASNMNCPHVFHHDCLLHWYHEVGRKARKKHLSRNPEVLDDDALESLCQFSKVCPCCRQVFCSEEEPKTESHTTATATNLALTTNENPD